MSMITEHIAETDNVGWSVIHPIRCPGNLLECPVTQIFREMTGLEDAGGVAGRFWAYTEQKGNQVVLVLGDRVPLEVQGTSKKTGHTFLPSRKRPDQR